MLGRRTRWLVGALVPVLLAACGDGAATARGANTPRQAGRTPVEMPDALTGAWARTSGRNCWAEQIEIVAGTITFQPAAASAAMRHARFIQAPTPARIGQDVTITTESGDRTTLHVEDASHFSDDRQCRYQRDD